MDYIAILLVVSFVCACISVLKPRSKTKLPLPPGPHPFPIIGNIFALGNRPHQSLANLSKTYGPLMTLKFGSQITIVVSSPNIVKQVVQKHKHLFVNRRAPEASRALNHDKFSIIWMPVGPQWKTLRKIYVVQLLTKQRLDASQALRAKKAQELISYVHQHSESGQAVDIAQTASTTSFNLISNTFFSIDMAGYGSSQSQEIQGLVMGLLEEIAKPNIADFVPILRLIDPQGIRRRSTIYLKTLIGIFDRIINERLLSRSSSMDSSKSNDILDELIKLTEENNHEFSYNDVSHLLIDLFVGAADTTSNTLEWAMAELLHNPTIMAKAKAELQEVIGKDNTVQESDLSSLPYLQAIIKETLRFHPAITFILRNADMDTELNGFTVPKDALVQVNLWAIFRDPSIWSSPNLFMPERFLGNEAQGRDFEFIPFGAGKRKCPGIPLVDRMVPLMLASLLQFFDWKLENGQKPEDMDMNDKFGITMQKVEPLRAIPIKI